MICRCQFDEVFRIEDVARLMQEFNSGHREFLPGLQFFE